MRTVLRQLSLATSRPAAGWLTLLLLLAVLVPSVCLLWFMKQAVRNEQLAGRQVLMEAYRAHLALAQGRLKNWREQILASVETNQGPHSALFAKTVRDGTADAIICYDAQGKVLYPAPELPHEPSSYGLAFQTKIRNLARAGKTPEVVNLIIDSWPHDLQLAGAVDERGRAIRPSLELMALELTNSPAIRNALEETLNSYEVDSVMPSAQRRFLMRRLTNMFPHQATFPTLAAEDLAARYLEAASEPLRDPTLKPASVPGLWQLASPDGRALLLFRGESLSARLARAASPQELPAGVDLSVLPPDRETANLLLVTPAGDEFPGWQIGLALKDRNTIDAVARAQVAFYVWVGALTMGTVVVLAVLGTGLIRRQAAVAQLRNDLLANVTHELKTPLSSMRLLVDTLLQSKPLHEGTAREYLQLIAAENLRLSRLIDNFLTFSRIERNKLAFDFAEVPAGAIAERAAAAVRERFNASGCEFSFRLQATPGLPPVRADADAMVTVLLNLLDNAWKYSGDEKRITLSAGAENGHVHFTVKDNGIGLSPRETKRIFKRFYQVDQRLARTGGGCGLGLSIVQFIVTAHHGAVEVESELHRGSAFTVTLPAAPQNSP